MFGIPCMYTNPRIRNARMEYLRDKLQVCRFFILHNLRYDNIYFLPSSI